MQVPAEIYREIALSLDLNSIDQLCRSNSYFNDAICNSDEFWRLKFRYDYPQADIKGRYLWKEIYKSWDNLYFFGKTIKLLSYPKFRSVATNGQVVYGIALNYDVYAWGSNVYGQLGLGKNFIADRPTKIPNFKCREIAVTDISTFFIDLNNNLWVLGALQTEETTPKNIFNIKSATPEELIQWTPRKTLSEVRSITTNGQRVMLIHLFRLLDLFQIEFLSSYIVRYSDHKHFGGYPAVKGTIAMYHQAFITETNDLYIWGLRR